MSNTSEIKSLEQIRERKVEIHNEMLRSKKAVVKQVQTTATDTKDFFLQDVMLPAAGIAVSLYLVTSIGKRLFRSKPQPAQQAPAQVAESESARTMTVASASSSSSQEDLPASQKPQPVPVRVVSRPKKSKSSALMGIGAMLIPAGKAILSAIQEAKQD